MNAARRRTRIFRTEMRCARCAQQKRCTDEAILIQRCMARNNHRQDRCKEEVEAWKRCTSRVKELVSLEEERRKGAG